MKTDEPVQPPATPAPAPSSELLLTCEALSVGFGETPLLPGFDLRSTAAASWRWWAATARARAPSSRPCWACCRPVSGRIVKSPV